MTRREGGFNNNNKELLKYGKASDTCHQSFMSHLNHPCYSLEVCWTFLSQTCSYDENTAHCSHT